MILSLNTNIRTAAEADNDDTTDKIKDDLYCLQESLQRTVAKLFLLAIYGINRSKQSADKAKKHYNNKDETEAQDKRQRCRLCVGKCQRKQDINKNRCHHTAKMHHHFAVENNVIPGGFCLLYQTRNDFQQDLPANSIRQISYQENSQECYKLI